MPRVGLRDDRWPGSCSPVGYVSSPFSVPVALDDDAGRCHTTPIVPGVTPGPGGDPEIPGLPRATIMRRIRDGWDADDNPMWTWEPTGQSVETISYVTREEYDDRAGITLVKARIVIGYPSTSVPLHETAIVRMDDGTTWQITGIEQKPSAAHLNVTRIDGGV